MPRCEVCHGAVRTKRAPTHDQDPHFVVSRMEFDADVGWTRGYKTYLCTRACAIEALEEGLLRDPDSPLFHAMRHEYEPDEATPDVGPLLERARELLVAARDQVDADREDLAEDQLWEYIQGAAARTESAQVLVDGLEVLEDSNAE